jgi:hypothetical protein
VNDEIGINVEYRDFHAYRDYMSHKLRVTGTCIVKGAGVAVELLDHEGPGGIDDQMLTLDLRFVITAEDPSEQPVEWEGDWDDGLYDEVEFRVVEGSAELPPLLKIEEIH